jgi:hypothetical protein
MTSSGTRIPLGTPRFSMGRAVFQSVDTPPRVHAGLEAGSRDGKVDGPSAVASLITRTDGNEPPRPGDRWFKLTCELRGPNAEQHSLG